MNADVIVIGAGLSGLACASTLRDNGLEPLVLEASDGIGGRIRTDQRQGFLLDRGFQVLQTWYPDARHLLDYDRLDLRPFYPGALVRVGGRLRRVSDVWRRPLRLPEMLVSPVGTLADKLRLLTLRHRCLRGDLEALYNRPESPACASLQALGFSARIIDRFFKPFFSGVFFDPELAVSSRAFEFVFRAFALGDTSLPARGMAEIPAQLAARLTRAQVRTGCRVDHIAERTVTLASGERLHARALVIATSGPAAARLLEHTAAPPAATASRGTTCVYFAAVRPPIEGPYLVLNGEGHGHVNSLLCPSNLSGHYAPAGQTLVSVNCHGAEHNPDTLETILRRELAGWFGDQVRGWERLAVYRIPQALPLQTPPVPYPGDAGQRVADWLWVCGEYHSAPSIQWALHSGRRAGADVARSLLGRVTAQSTAGLRLPSGPSTLSGSAVQKP
jgi:phytoene dehydrogenase-like protein